MFDETDKTPQTNEMNYRLYAQIRSDMCLRLEKLLARVKYRAGYEFRIGTTSGMKYPFVQVGHWRKDAYTDQWEWGRGSKAYISEHATDSEIFQTLFNLAKAYEDDEVRRFLRVDDKRVFGLPALDTPA